jgi:hypothetical protein
VGLAGALRSGLARRIDKSLFTVTGDEFRQIRISTRDDKCLADRRKLLIGAFIDERSCVCNISNVRSSLEACGICPLNKNVPLANPLVTRSVISNDETHVRRSSFCGAHLTSDENFPILSSCTRGNFGCALPDST